MSKKRTLREQLADAQEDIRTLRAQVQSLTERLEGKATGPYIAPRDWQREWPAIKWTSTGTGEADIAKPSTSSRFATSYDWGSDEQ